MLFPFVKDRVWDSAKSGISCYIANQTAYISIFMPLLAAMWITLWICSGLLRGRREAIGRVPHEAGDSGNL